MEWNVISTTAKAEKDKNTLHPLLGNYEIQHEDLPLLDTSCFVPLYPFQSVYQSEFSLFSRVLAHQQPENQPLNTSADISFKFSQQKMQQPQQLVKENNNNDIKTSSPTSSSSSSVFRNKNKSLPNQDDYNELNSPKPAAGPSGDKIEQEGEKREKQEFNWEISETINQIMNTEISKTTTQLVTTPTAAAATQNVAVAAPLVQAKNTKQLFNRKFCFLVLGHDDDHMNQLNILQSLQGFSFLHFFFKKKLKITFHLCKKKIRY